MTDTPGHGRTVDRQVVLSVWVPSACISLSRGLLLPVLPLYALSFDAGYGLVGLVLAAQGIGNLAGDIPAGMVTRRLGQKRTMIIGGVGMAAASLALAASQTIVEALVYQLLTGLAMALWNIARHTYVTETVRLERRGRIYAVLGGIGRIAGFAGPAAGGLIAQASGLTAPFYLTAALTAAGVLAVLLWVREAHAAATPQAAHGHGVAQVLRDHWRVLVSAGSGQLCGQTVRNARNVVVPLYAAEVLGLEASAVGLIISLSYGIDMLMFVPAGQIMDRLGRKFAYVPSFVLQSIALACVPLTGSFWSLALVTMALGMGNGLGSGTMMTLGADLAPARGRGEFLGMWRFIGDGGSAAGPLVVGEVAQLASLSAAPVVLAGIGVLGAVLLATLVPETLQRRT